MATRRPLVSIAGAVQELPIGDSVAGAAGGGGVSSWVAKYNIVGGLGAAPISPPRWYPEQAVAVNEVYFSLGTAPQGGGPASIDVLKNGASILGGNYPSCAVGAYKSNTVSGLNVSVLPTDYLTIIVRSAAGADAVVCIKYS